MRHNMFLDIVSLWMSVPLRVAFTILSLGMSIALEVLCDKIKQKSLVRVVKLPDKMVCFRRMFTLDRPWYFYEKYIIVFLESASVFLIYSILLHWARYISCIFMFISGMICAVAALVCYRVFKHRGIIYNDRYIGVLSWNPKKTELLAWSNISSAKYVCNTTKLILLSENAVVTIYVKDGLALDLVRLAQKNVTDFKEVMQVISLRSLMKGGEYYDKSE